ncbi:uncharacterized protein LOC110901387 [Helianthus annuus]|uniref:uncharacterized protein LOC110901387 n=1 Tax=Helianthus annuus TaxID=4232 RepID=UPI000B8F2804|nr:uncharacterized protein LOC110901387 [Helianthus annuus]
MTGEVLKDIADKALMGKLKEVDSESEESKSVSSVSVKREESGVQEIKSVNISESESNNVGKADCVEQVLDEESEKSEKAQSEKVVSDSEDEGNFLDRYSKLSVEVKKMENALKIDSNIFKDDVVEFENEVDKFLAEFPPITNKVKTIVKEEVPNVIFDFPKTHEKCDVVFGSVSEGLPKSILSKWIMDSGASRHMTGTLALLYDVKSINGSYVGFAGNQGGRIVGQGTLSNGVISFNKGSNVVFDPLHNTCCDLDMQKNPELAKFSGILEFMGRIPIQKALTDQRPLYRSHIERFWKNVSYDDQNKVISSIVEVHGKNEKILVTEALIREVVNFPDEAESPIRFSERMVKGCMLRMGYQGALNAGNYLKSKFQKPYKFLIHCVLMSLSHTKGSYDSMRDYQMNMVTALVLNKKYNFSHIVFHYMAENIKTDSKSWMYSRFVQMLIDHAYPEIDRNIKNDLLVQSHMSNDSLKQLARYHPNHPEPKDGAEFFGFIKDANYVDPDPVDHQNWRNEAERKEAAYDEELKILKDFKNSKNEWYVKETGRRRRRATPKAQEGEGSSSKPKKKQKKAAEMSLIDEPEEDETVVAAEEDPFNVEEHLLFDTEVLETGPTVEVEAERVVNVEAQKGKDKVIDDIEGDDVDKDTTSSSSSSDEEVVDETEQHASELQSPPGGRKKAGARKKVVSPKIRKVTPKISKPKIVLKKKPTKETRKTQTPPHEPTPHQSPIHSPPRQPTPPQPSSPPKQPTPPRQPSPIHHSPLHLSPPPQQTLFTSQEIFQTPPLTQGQLTPSSTGYRGFPAVPSNLGVSLDDVGDFDIANTSQVKNVEKKVDEVIAENKKLSAENKKVADRERILEMRVKKLEGDNKQLLKKIDSDQSEIDILKVRVAELEEEKARRDEQNEYFKLKNKELETAKAFRDHEFYMLNKVVESMLGMSVEQRFEELQVEELRAEHQAKIDEQMKDKGKGTEGSSAVTERSIVPSMVVENPEPISAISGLFEEDTLLDELIDDDDDDAQGGTGVKVSEASTEKTVDDLMNDSVNEESRGADRQGESGDAQNVQQAQKLILRLDTYREEGDHFRTYTLKAIKEMTHMVNPDFKFDFEEELDAEFEEELNAFDINQQPKYEYRYVEEADMYDRVEVKDWTDDESVSEDTSQLPTLMEVFTEENRDKLRRKVAEILKDVNFDGTPKDMAKEERKKWSKESHERKFKRPLKYYQRDRSVSLGDIIRWGFLPQINAYAIRRECGVQYFEM